jgi:hypothetical protein
MEILKEIISILGPVGLFFAIVSILIVLFMVFIAINWIVFFISRSWSRGK